MERDERLEYLSDQVRRGIPVGFYEALEVIHYQESRKATRLPWWGRLLNWVRKEER